MYKCGKRIDGKLYVKSAKGNGWIELLLAAKAYEEVNNS